MTYTPTPEQIIIMKTWQQALLKLGYDLGPEEADGLGGHDTQQAILKFQNDHPPLEATGQFDTPTQIAINKLLTPKKVNLLQFLPLLLEFMTKGSVNMNASQTTTLINAVVGVLSGIFIAKGIGDASVWESGGAFIVAAVTWYLSHQHDKKTV